MKITIETDAAGASPAATMPASFDSGTTATGDHDGGAGPPGSGASGEAASSDTDGGSPPQALLDAIAAAEAAGQMPGQSDSGGGQDAGAGPASI